MIHCYSHNGHTRDLKKLHYMVCFVFDIHIMVIAACSLTKVSLCDITSAQFIFFKASS